MHMFELSCNILARKSLYPAPHQYSFAHNPRTMIVFDLAWDLFYLINTLPSLPFPVLQSPSITFNISTLPKFKIY